MLTEQHAHWLLTERGIPTELAQELGITSSGKDLAFEYRRGSEKRFRKIRTGDKRFWIEPKGAELCLWNEDSLSGPCAPGTPLVICEGELDAASWLLAGATHVVSVPNGAAGKPGAGDIVPANDRQFAYLWDGNHLKANVDKFKSIILATDDDEPGRILRDELSVRLGRNRCYFVVYPKGCKDANEVLVRHGENALVDMLANARPLVPNKLVGFDDIVEPPETAVYRSGWHEMDRHLKLVPPELVIVTGPPGSGKSQWTLNWVANLARWSGLKGAILQFEDSPARNRRHLLSYAMAWGEAGQEPIENPVRWVSSMFRTIAPVEDDDVSFTFNWLEEAIVEAAQRHSCRWVVIDPWNEVEHLWGSNETETDYTNRALRALKQLARRLQIAIIVVAHPSKSGGQANTIQTMSLYDVSGSAAWKNKADHGIVVLREGNMTHVKVDKCKDHELMGVPGVVSFVFDMTNAVFRVAREADRKANEEQKKNDG